MEDLTYQELIDKLRELNGKKQFHADIYHKLAKRIEKMEKLIKEKCDHKKVWETRYYSSGMHRPEYTWRCKKCFKNLSFDEYCKIDNCEVDKIDG